MKNTLPEFRKTVLLFVLICDGVLLQSNAMAQIATREEVAEYVRENWFQHLDYTGDPTFAPVVSYGCLSGDCQNGDGVYRAEGGNLYRGGFQNGKLHGTIAGYNDKGKLFFYGEVVDGETVDGCIRGDCENGSGVWMYGKNGDGYDGEFVDGKRHGEGLYLWALTGITYYGSWVNNKREGFGFTRGPDDRLEYEGSFLNNQRHGQGKLYSKEGRLLFSGEFKNGRKVEANQGSQNASTTSSATTSKAELLTKLGRQLATLLKHGEIQEGISERTVRTSVGNYGGAGSKQIKMYQHVSQSADVKGTILTIGRKITYYENHGDGLEPNGHGDYNEIKIDLTEIGNNNSHSVDESYMNPFQVFRTDAGTFRVFVTEAMQVEKIKAKLSQIADNN